MGWLVKEVTETVTHRRQTSQCDGCGKEEYQGRPVIGDPPLGWSKPKGWLGFDGGEKDDRGWTVHRLACSAECASIVMGQAFKSARRQGQLGGVKRFLGLGGQGNPRP